MIIGPKKLLQLVKTKQLVEGLADRELTTPEGAGFDLRETLPGAVHLFEDALDAGGPDEGSGLGVPSIKEGEDGALELGHAAKGAAAHRLLHHRGERRRVVAESVVRISQ